jgi:hypothetical protein
MHGCFSEGLPNSCSRTISSVASLPRLLAAERQDIMRTAMSRHLRYGWLMLLAVFPSGPTSAAPKVDPVVIIRDTRYLPTILGGDRVFVAGRRDGYAARADVERYVWAQMKSAKSGEQSLRWRQVRLKRPVYIWHCGGYTNAGSDFVFADCLSTDETFHR